MKKLRELSVKAQGLCERQGWGRDWVSVSCHLHLEASEFVEALRGKNGDPVEEAGDVLFVLLSAMVEHNLDLEDVVAQLHKKIDGYGDRDEASDPTEKEVGA